MMARKRVLLAANGARRRSNKSAASFREFAD
jgi:hypothetical protein